MTFVSLRRQLLAKATFVAVLAIGALFVGSGFVTAPAQAAAVSMAPSALQKAAQTASTPLVEVRRRGRYRGFRGFRRRGFRSVRRFRRGRYYRRRYYRRRFRPRLRFYYGVPRYAYSPYRCYKRCRYRGYGRHYCRRRCRYF